MTHYGNFVLGGVSISVVLYLSVFLWLFGRKNDLNEIKPKYQNKKVPTDEANKILSELNNIMQKDKLYLNPELKSAQIAEKLDISVHLLSQLLNDNLQINFNQFINTFRIEAAKKMIETNDQITLEAIGVECGFKSKSSFYTAFKSALGQTPAQYRKAWLKN